MIKYTPHTHAAVSLVERNDEIQSLCAKRSALFESIQELLPVGKLKLKFSQCKTKQDRMKDQINYLKRTLDDLHRPDSSFADETNESLLSNLQTQISLCESDAIKLLDQITKAELDNVSHTLDLKLSAIDIPFDSDLNQDEANDILFSYIENSRNLNISVEKQYCLSKELNCYLNLLSDEKDNYEKFKSETNEMIQRLEELTEEKRNESERQSQKYEKLQINEKKLVDDFQSRMDLLKVTSDYFIEKTSNSDEDFDPNLIHAINELFLNLQDPNAKDGEVKLIVKSIIHLSNLKSISFNDGNNENSNISDPNNNNDTNFNFTYNKPNKFEGFNSFISNNTKNDGFSSFIRNSNFKKESTASSENKMNTSFANDNSNSNFNLSSNNDQALFPLKNSMIYNSTKSQNDQSFNQTFESLKQKASTT